MSTGRKVLAMEPNMPIMPIQISSVPGNIHSSGHAPMRRRNNHRVTIRGMMSERLSLGDAAKLEMQLLPTKTPVSVLQELLSRRGITPKYELVQIEGAIHEPIFRYRVLLSSEFVATGTGRSKKEAKHGAAKNLLDLLVGKQTHEQANATNGIIPPAAAIQGTDAHVDQVVASYDDKLLGNPIGWLQELCMSRRWPPPTYNMIHEEGLPHERQFTISCEVLKHREVGCGKSKKVAKRMAAHKMWQVLQDVPVDTPPAIQYEEDEDDLEIHAQNRYATLKDSKIPTLTTPHSHKVSHFHKSLKHASGKKLSELQTVPLNATDFNFVQFLHEIAIEQQFEVTYVDIEEKSLSGKCQCLVQLSSLPVAVCYGSGSTSKDAQKGAAHNALEYLKIMTKK